MLILINVNVQYSEKVVFSFENGSNSQNHSYSLTPPNTLLAKFLINSPLNAIWNTLNITVVV